MIIKLPQLAYESRFHWVNPDMVAKLTPRDETLSYDRSTGEKLAEPVVVHGTEVQLITPYGPERLHVLGTPDEVARMLAGGPSFGGVPVSVNPLLGEPGTTEGPFRKFAAIELAGNEVEMDLTWLVYGEVDDVISSVTKKLEALKAKWGERQPFRVTIRPQLDGKQFHALASERLAMRAEFDAFMAKKGGGVSGE